MKRFALIVTIVFVQAALASGPGLCDLALNEMMGDPASDWDGDGVYDYRGDEWVEVINTGGSTIDLSSYRLGDPLTLAYGFTGDLGPGDVLVVYGSESKEWESDNGYSSFGFNMSNDGDTVILYQISGGDTLIVDSHTFNTYEAEDDRSSGRYPDGDGGWEIFDFLNPYFGGTAPFGNGLEPTPGSLNTGLTPTPTRETTWGSIKSIYQLP
ncbi:MAG: lamin tail domain-containing protein [Candidatus Eisenbacteria bacterium]|uniref:Lamin tail domain-containing protein n=1 Tax=Eiseniibacteriota bacterium TaxID=2212470 RepID=A0A948W6R4_UNCEI|nr:lamin tail domain-containing protein [Candidatus Eisenbacteria bacterium]MBU1947624.1 lamin tail domain-containing protein [Candidatus Eisenbacteria bacterium]MBU2691794.1 lamin tail domain-containing protein [Candidatus Eisenbacteria bacterium]